MKLASYAVDGRPTWGAVIGEYREWADQVTHSLAQLERAAADYAKKASAAGLAAKKAAKGMTKTRKGKALTAAALALVGYAAVKMARKR